MEEYNRCVIEILTEEPSMEYFLRGILPRILTYQSWFFMQCGFFGGFYNELRGFI